MWQLGTKLIKLTILNVIYLLETLLRNSARKQKYHLIFSWKLFRQLFYTLMLRKEYNVPAGSCPLNESNTTSFLHRKQLSFGEKHLLVEDKRERKCVSIYIEMNLFSSKIASDTFQRYPNLVESRNWTNENGPTLTIKLIKCETVFR